MNDFISSSRCEVHRLNPALNMVLGWRYPNINGKKDWNDNLYWSTLVVQSTVSTHYSTSL
jgi:hypothetical protein